ncbi:unnamed protein product [Cochlearia groenlandica]
MAFWGAQVKSGKPFTLKANEPTNVFKRLHLSQATLGFGNATMRSILQCNVGNKSPLFLCALSPDKTETCQLNIEFEESEDVIFSVIGPQSIHITGYFLGSSGFRLNDDQSESFGEDVGVSDMEKDSSDDYDFSDSFINDDDDDKSLKELASKAKEKKSNGKSRRLRKIISDSESDETSPIVVEDDSSSGDSVQVLNNANDCEILSSENPLPSRVTRSKARDLTVKNGGDLKVKCEKIIEATTLVKTEDQPLGDVQNGCEILSKKKRKREKSNSLDDGEGRHVPGSLKNVKKETIDKVVVEASGEVMPSENGGDGTTPSKKKRKKDRREETANDPGKLHESPKKKKHAINIDKNIEEEGGSKEPQESETSSSEVIIKEFQKGKLEGKQAISGKKVSILYTGKLKDTEKVFESNLGEALLRFRLGGDKVIKGLSVGVEGMRVGDKRRLIIPPALGYSKEGLKEVVPKNAWLVYEVEAVKVR